MGACDGDGVTVQDYFLVWFISSWFGEDGFYDAIGDLVPRLSEIFFFGIDIFIECLQMLEVCLRSCCCRSTFDICMVHLIFFMVCGDGCILRTHRVLGKGVVFAFIWHVILGLMMVSFLCYGILLIRI